MAEEGILLITGHTKRMTKKIFLLYFAVTAHFVTVTIIRQEFKS